MHHLQLFISCIHACFALHVCTTPPVQKQAMSICVCPLTSGRQASNKLHLAAPLPSPLIKPISLTTTTTTRTHTHTTASTHARTHQCLPPCISSLLRAIASFVPGSTVALSYLLFFTPSLSLSFLPSYASSPLPSLRYVPAACNGHTIRHTCIRVCEPSTRQRSHKYMAA